MTLHDDVIKWKHFPHYWPFVRGIHRPPVNSPHKGQWRGALMFSLIYVWVNDWVNNREASDAIGPILTLSGPFWRHCNDQMTFSVIFNIFLTTFVENLLITLHILRTKEIIDKYDKMCYTYVNMTGRDAQLYRRKDNALKTSHCWCSIKYICAQCDKKFRLYVLLY